MSQHKNQTRAELIGQLQELQTKAAEFEVRKKYWEELYESSPDAIAILDNREYILQINREFTRLFGFTEEEALGRDINELIIPDHLTEEGLYFKSRATRGLMVEGESIRRAKNGTEFHVSLRGKPVVLGENQLAIIAIYRDISAKKQAENALHESKERYRAVVESTPALICRFLPDGTLTFVNSNYCRYFNTTEDRLLGKNFFQFIPLPDQEKVRNHFLSLTVEKPMVTYEHKVIAPDNTICWQEWIDQALFDEKGNLLEFQSLGRDITSAKRAREEKNRLETQLRQAQKLEAIGTLAGGIAHDFNNILGIILGFTELALDDTQEGTLIYKNLKQVIKAGNRAKELIKQILTFSRQFEHKMGLLRIGPTIEEALVLLRSTLPSTIEIRQHIARNEGAVFADPIQIQQVFMNLCVNAGQAMGRRGGVLEVNLESVELERESLTETDLPPGPYIRLSVSDNGPGIPPELRKRIFDPYFTTKEPGDGTGLGLSVVHGIVKEHKGEIQVYSEVGIGTTFHVYFPIVEGDEVIPPGEIETILTGTESSLLVDDDAILLEIEERMLNGLGYRTEKKINSLEALEAFRQSPKAFDLVITDQTMPLMTGTQLAVELRAIRPDIPIILNTGFSDSVNEENFTALGIDAFVMKPFTKRNIARVIREVLEKKRSAPAAD